MYQYRIAYRHQDGSLEGFVGTGFTAASAERAAAAKAWRKAISVSGGSYRAERLIRTSEGLSASEMAQLKSDWEIETRPFIAGIQA